LNSAAALVIAWSIGQVYTTWTQCVKKRWSLFTTFPFIIEPLLDP
jgi:hypothetical protein